MTNLSILVEPLKREVAIPGDFDVTFPDTADTDLVGALADGFAEAQLQGFFQNATLQAAGDDYQVVLATAPDANSPVIQPESPALFPEQDASTPVPTTPTLSLAGGALIVWFAAIRITRSQIRNLNSMEKYQAGPVQYEIQRAATALQTELKFMQDRLNTVITTEQSKAQSLGTLAQVSDNYMARYINDIRMATVGGFYSWELAAPITDWYWR